MVVLALKKVRKKFTNHGVRKTTVSKLKKANLMYCNFRIYRHCQRPQRYKFPQRLRWSRRRRATMTLSCNIQMNNKTPALRKNKYYINTGGSFRHHNNCGSTHPSATAASKENKFAPSFSGCLILKNFSMNPAMMNILSSNRKQEHPPTSYQTSETLE